TQPLPLPRSIRISTITDPWDALDVLEGHVNDPDFFKRWREFLRACCVLLVPALPPEAHSWIGAADDFDGGRLTGAELTEVRVRAWHFHDSRRDSSPNCELSGLRAVMCRLWPEHDVVQWCDEAWFFLDS